MHTHTGDCIIAQLSRRRQHFYTQQTLTVFVMQASPAWNLDNIFTEPVVHHVMWSLMRCDTERIEIRSIVPMFCGYTDPSLLYSTCLLA